MPDWKDQIAALDIADVAQKLGLQVAPGRRSPRQSICPFHDDTKPSLYLYQNDDPHFHCFTCHAHGDTVELVKRSQQVDFAGALSWLGATYGLTFEGRGRRTPGARQDIRERALTYLRERGDTRALAAFAASRRFEVEPLSAAGITAGSLGGFLRSLGRDRETLDKAVAEGLAHAPDPAVPAALRSGSLVPFVPGEQIFIPLTNLRGRVLGLMARRLTGEGPKYRFTAGFKKSEILYRGDHVRRQIDTGKGGAALDGAADRFDLFIVEGVFDALRLEAAGLPAVALLGASISDDQLAQIGELAEVALTAGRALRVHVFLDADKAGRRGTADALPRLLRRASDAEFLVDVVAVDPPAGEKRDPDELLVGLNAEEALAFVSDRLLPALDALAAISLDLPFGDMAGAVAALDAAGSIVLQNRLARRLQRLDWPKIWRNLTPDETTLGGRRGASEALSRAYGRLAQDLDREARHDIGRILPEPFLDGARVATDASLLHAMVLARESNDSREYPVDVAAWERIESGAPLFLPVIADALRRAQGPQRPFLAHYEAKDSGAPRLKCGPCPEDAIQQQYVLTELLRIRPENRDIAERIPAVRFWPDQPSLVVTGVVRPDSAVSFAYQIDMRALEERPDRTRRRDMFRPFLDCWNSFIRHIGRRLERMRCELIYVARLDIKSFYDHIPRHEVDHLLDRVLPDADTLEALGVASLLGDREGDKRDTLRRWILEHSFGPADQGYAYVDPGSGKTARRDGGGTKGLPQGPVLSSYLANIALFDLDAALEARIQGLDAAAAAEDGPQACGGLYARYVDDIVIAARSPEELRALRLAIEAKLEGLGLELNEKSEHLAPMTAEEARNWVVERRGAGFVAYGEVDDQPSPAPDLRSSWADIPTLDRRTALSVLHWTALDDPEETPWEEFERILVKVAQAEALRPPDRGHIARRIVLRAALGALDPLESDDPTPAIDQFERLTDKFLGALRARPTEITPRLRPEDAPVAKALAAAREFLAVLTGLERLILGAPEDNPTFSSEVRREIRSAKGALLRWIVNDDLLGRLQLRLVPDDARAAVRARLGAQIQIQAAILEERAAQVLRLGRFGELEIRHRPPDAAPVGPGAEILAIGWRRTFAPDALADHTDALPDRLYHVIAAGAQAEGGRLTPAAGPEHLTMPSLFSAIKAAADARLTTLPAESGGGQHALAQAFRALAGATAPPSGDWSMRVLAALLTLSAGPNQSEAVSRRNQLITALIPGAVIIPLPPVPDQPGFFCYEHAAGRRTVHAILVAALDEPATELPAGLDWRESQTVGALRRWSADLPDGQGFLLDPMDHTRQIEDDLGTLADVFEGLSRQYGVSAGPTTTLLHVFSLVGPLAPRVPDDPNEPGPYVAVAWRMPRERVERLLFERRGDGLAVQRSPHAGAELWRIGQAISDLFDVPSEAEAEEDAAGFKHDARLLRDRLKRTALSRLRGRWINAAQIMAALATHSLPRSLNRIVAALRETASAGDGVGPLALEFLLGGRAMRSRIRLGSGVVIPGGWARHLELVGGQSLRPADDEGMFALVPPRDALARPSRALTRAGDAVSEWAERAGVGRCGENLHATSLGFELAALRLDLRDLALAILARLTPEDHVRVGLVRPEIASLGAGPVYLLEPRFGHGEASGGDEDRRPWGYDGEWQGKELFVTLAEALGQRALQGRAALDRISTAGWLVVLSVMCGALDFEMGDPADASNSPLRPRFFPLADPAAAAPLRNLAATLLALAPKGGEDLEAWPWELAHGLDVASLRAALNAARASLGAVQAAAGIVAVLNPAPLRALSLNDHGAEFLTASGDQYRLPWWRCPLTTAASERIDRAETVADGDRLFHPCSWLEDANGVLVLQVVSESLAKITELQARISPDSAGQDDGGSPEAPRESGEKLEAADVAASPTADEITEKVADEALSDGSSPKPAAPRQPRDSASRSALSKSTDVTPRALWRERQRISWKARGEGAGLAASGYGRVAILQYDFVESYAEEIFPDNYLAGERCPETQVLAGAVDWRLSFEEHRRRQVLAAVLSCCESLGVECLVLPEYSTWPETVNWLEQHCRQRRYKVSIWAGTFRQQAGFALDVSGGRYKPVPVDAPTAKILPMETHLSVIFRETQDGTPLKIGATGEVADEIPIFQQKLAEGVRHRPKKYPSIGMGEEFKPSTQVLTPLMAASHSVRRIESFVSELVCSELFVFNGPLNWRNFADHLAASAKRYKVEPAEGGWLEGIIKDAREAALVFSGADERKPRRSLLFVTCATSRDADYHYFAQSAYLASGLVTAFCNSSRKPATGGSCFVGQGGWETRGDGVAVPSPYHGAVPGILTNGHDRGDLGPRERALIVADIRPERTVEDKPRSQALGAPMRLVAHIPILEDAVATPVADRWAPEWFRTRRGAWVVPEKAGPTQLADPTMHELVLHEAAASGQIDIDTFVGNLAAALESTAKANSTHAVNAEERDTLVAAAVSLAGLFSESPGMRARAAALAKAHRSHPERLPCPALLDWLIVDLNVSAFVQNLEALAPLRPKDGLVALAELPPGLDEAPWRWLPPTDAPS
jgi:hypothetical protein